MISFNTASVWGATLPLNKGQWSDVALVKRKSLHMKSDSQLGILFKPLRREPFKWNQGESCWKRRKGRREIKRGWEFMMQWNDPRNNIHLISWSDKTLFLSTSFHNHLGNLFSVCVSFSSTKYKVTQKLMPRCHADWRGTLISHLSADSFFSISIFKFIVCVCVYVCESTSSKINVTFAWGRNRHFRSDGDRLFRSKAWFMLLR